MSKSNDKVLSVEEFKELERVVSPRPVMDEEGKPVIDEKGEVKLEEVTQEDLDHVNNVLFKKDANVGTVVQVTSLFVNTLRNFMLANVQGLADTINIQKRVIDKLAGDDVDVKSLEREAISEFEEEMAEKYAAENALSKGDNVIDLDKAIEK